MMIQRCLRFLRYYSLDPPGAFQPADTWFQNFRSFAIYIVSNAILDFFPPLRYLPEIILPIRKTGQEIFKRDLGVFSRRYLRCKSEYENGTLKPCFCEAMIEHQKVEGMKDDLSSFTVGALINVIYDYFIYVIPINEN